MGKGRKNIVWFRFIIMDVKRIIIDIDSSPNIKGGTALPASLIGKKNVLSAETQDTGTPEQQEDYRKLEAIEKIQNGERAVETIGRTPSDLVFTLINRPEFVPTALTCLSFIIFVSKLKNITDFWLPIAAAIVFNGVWFSITIFRRIVGRLKKK